MIEPTSGEIAYLFQGASIGTALTVVLIVAALWIAKLLGPK